MGRRVIRCNVNNLLLAVVVIESIFLGWFFLGILLTPAGFTGQEDTGSIAKPKDFEVKKSINESMPENDDEVTHGISLGALISSIVLFLLQLVGVVFLVLGYKRQNHKPLGLFLIWLILSNLFFIIILIITACYSYSYPHDLSSPYKVFTVSTSGKQVELKDFIPPKPLVKILRNTMDNFNCIIIPLLVIKLILFLYELVSVFLSIKYFKSLQPPPSETMPASADKNNDNKGSAAPDGDNKEKQKLVPEEQQEETHEPQEA